MEKLHTYVVKIEANIPPEGQTTDELKKRPYADFHGVVEATSPYDAVKRVIDDKLGFNGCCLQYFHRIHVDRMRDGYVK